VNQFEITQCLNIKKKITLNKNSQTKSFTNFKQSQAAFIEREHYPTVRHYVIIIGGFCLLIRHFRQDRSGRISGNFLIIEFMREFDLAEMRHLLRKKMPMMFQIFYLTHQI
jgi:hypothetical protein